MKTITEKDYTVKADGSAKGGVGKTGNTNPAASDKDVNTVSANGAYVQSKASSDSMAFDGRATHDYTNSNK